MKIEETIANLLKEAKKAQTLLSEQDKEGSAYAIGMAKAKEIMGDEKPLEKKTIEKAKEIAKEILKKEETEDEKKKREEEEKAKAEAEKASMKTESEATPNADDKKKEDDEKAKAEKDKEEIKEVEMTDDEKKKAEDEAKAKAEKEKAEVKEAELTDKQKTLPPALQKAIKDKEEKEAVKEETEEEKAKREAEEKAKAEKEKEAVKSESEDEDDEEQIKDKNAKKPDEVKMNEADDELAKDDEDKDDEDKDEVNESKVSDEAKSKNLQYYGFGRYGKDNKVTHKSENGSLKELPKDQQKKVDHDDKQLKTSHTAAAHKADYEKHMHVDYEKALDKDDDEAAEAAVKKAEAAATRHFKLTGKKIYDPGYTGGNKPHPHITSNESFEVDVSADVEALLKGETLSEDFKAKAKVIFENVVINRVKDEIARISNDLKADNVKNIAAIKESLIEKVDGYLSYVVEQWVLQNEIALESGIKNEIMEDFVSGLRNLFEDHYIEVPNERFDVLSDLQDKLNTTKKKLDEATTENAKVLKAFNDLRKHEIISVASKDLVSTDAEKLKTLAEELSFEDDASFEKKVQTIRDNYFSALSATQNSTSKIVDTIVTDEPIVINESAKITDVKIAAYAELLTRSKK